MASIKSVVLTAAAVTGIFVSSQAQMFKDYVKDAKGIINKGTGKGGSTTESEVASGLKEALQVGAKNATGRLSVTNGFFGNAIIKILMPPEAKKVENTMRDIGMGSYVDKTILSMNRAAEDASGKALQIFVNAITSMTISDAVSILNGSNDAATQYLKNKTTAALTSAFRPIIQASLDKVNATKYWTELFTIYNKLPTTRQKVNPDLVAYVTERALSGVFVNIADEELKIRQDPAARVTDLLKKVFGSRH